MEPALPAPVVMDIIILTALEVPQEFRARTDKVPPKAFEVTVIVFVVEFPVQPEGKVQA